MRRSTLLAANLFWLGSHAEASAALNDQPVYQQPATWVVDAPAPDDKPGPVDAALRTVYIDTQVRISPDGTQDTYAAYRFKVLKPEALVIGNLSVTWQPDEGAMTIHQVRVIRGAQTTDVLASTKFTVLQREAQLEQSMLNGERTATLQVPGLEVGDEIVFSFTIRRHEAAFDGHVADMMQMPITGTPGIFRFRLTSPHGHALTLRSSKDMPPLRPTVISKEDVFDYVVRNPSGAIPTQGAPQRYNIRRLIEFSDFGTWADVSKRMAPLYERAAKLAPKSLIKAEAATIATANKDPAARAQAALQLVEDRVRYVFVGLNGGNYTPASADETWSRRFGDCKAKTALLVALLRELGIEAIPALVTSTGGDGLDERLPSPRPFDHVIVRAVVAGKTRWLDGTRLGDRSLDTLPTPFRWALPITEKGTELERIAPHDTDFPMFTSIADIDQSKGVDKDARVLLRNIVRGDEAFAIRTSLAGLSKDDADRVLKTYWGTQASWVTPDRVSWSYDERRMAVALSITGTGNPGWKGNAKKGHRLDIIGAGFYAPDPLRRPQEQDQTAPWNVPYPLYRCWATTIRLPEPGSKFAWSLSADPMYRKLGGFTYWRASGHNGAIVRTVMSKRAYEAEASQREAAIVNKAIPTFNNNMSQVSEELISERSAGNKQVLPFDDNVDWLNQPIPCSPGS